MLIENTYIEEMSKVQNLELKIKTYSKNIDVIYELFFYLNLLVQIRLRKDPAHYLL